MSASALEKIWLEPERNFWKSGSSPLDKIFVKEALSTAENPAWCWTISIGGSDTIVGMQLDDQIWPELITTYGFTTAVFRDAFVVYTPVKWMHLLSDASMQETLLKMAKILAKVLESTTMLVIPGEPSEPSIVLEYLEEGTLFTEVLQKLSQECGKGKNSFSQITDAEKYLQLTA